MPALIAQRGTGLSVRKNRFKTLDEVACLTGEEAVSQSGEKLSFQKVLKRTDGGAYAFFLGRVCFFDLVVPSTSKNMNVYKIGAINMLWLGLEQTTRS